MSEDYNGWTNRETWATALHYDNNGELYKIKQRAVKALAHLDKDQATFILDRILDETITNALSVGNMPKNHGILQDIGSLWRVNWKEIAEHFLNEEASA